jgi:hypothetical protein
VIEPIASSPPCAMARNSVRYDRANVVTRAVIASSDSALA